MTIILNVLKLWENQCKPKKTIYRKKSSHKFSIRLKLSQINQVFIISTGGNYDGSTIHPGTAVSPTATVAEKRELQGVRRCC